jgi:hypothetical protein
VGPRPAPQIDAEDPARDHLEVRVTAADVRVVEDQIGARFAADHGVRPVEGP